MARSPLKGAEAFIVQRRPVLRAIIYATISLMSLVNLAMLGSSWTNADFMRRNGSFVGAFNTASTIVTMVISAMFAVATIVQKRALARDEPIPKFCKRLMHDRTEKIISCLMAAWWLGMAFALSNMAYVYREDIRRCMQGRSPKQQMGVEVAKTAIAAAATACAVFRGSLTLNWCTWLMWMVRMWRTFTRSNIHFDSTIFREPSDSALDMQSFKNIGMPVPINPATFSLHYPEGLGPNHTMHDLQFEDSAVQRLVSAQYQINGSRPCAFQNNQNAQFVTHADRAQAAVPQQATHAQQISMPIYHQATFYQQNQDTNRGFRREMSVVATQNMANSNANKDVCCQGQGQNLVVGTATLTTEPLSTHNMTT
ncbi:hypothetical protein LPJ66_004683 [Kickxella alabastrina]|uniref:Uncharacterized protein n=1 Tax=Kickxella alabastrina TaxID=61397 RepID=A0ACC1IGC2_9FUNG|nr:hypothetical protein LPJ66_004683 [Kickxella alabastrina]